MLFVLDGLDEIPTSKNGSIYDFLPEESLLDEGVFILLTARTDIELVDNPTSYHLKSIQPTATQIVDKQDKLHKDLLINYIEKTLKVTDSALVNKILEKSENRFLYLRMIKELLKSNQGVVIDDLPLGKDLFDYFLKTLLREYGEKFFLNIIKILSILSSSYHSLTVKEISYLLGYQEPTFYILAILVDIRGFLKLDRSEKGNRVSIAHIELKDMILQQFNENIKQLINGWIELHYDEETKNINADHDGELYVHSNLVNYSKQYLAKVDHRLRSKDYIYLLFYIIDELRNRPFSVTNMKTMINITNQALFICEDLKGSGVNVQKEVIQSYMYRGYAFNYSNQLKESVDDFKKCVMLHEQGLEENGFIDEDKYGRALMNTGILLFYSKRYQESEIFLNKSLSLRRKLAAAGEALQQDLLTMDLMGRGALFRLTKRVEKALTDYNECIEIRERLYDQHLLRDEYDLGRGLFNRGLLYRDIRNLPKAIEDFSRCIWIQEDLIKKNKMVFDGDLAGVLQMRGSVYRDCGSYPEASQDFAQARKIVEKHILEGRSTEVHLSLIQLNEAMLLRVSGQPQETIELLKRLIAQLVRRKQEYNDISEVVLAHCYLHLGLAYHDVDDFDGAVRNIKESTHLLEQIHSEGEQNEDFLSINNMNLAIMLYKCNQSKEAISLMERTYLDQKAIMENGKMIDKNFLAITLMNLSILYWEVGLLEKARSGMEESIQIQHELYSQNKLYHSGQLAISLANLKTIKGRSQWESVEITIPSLKTPVFITAYSDWMS